MRRSGTAWVWGALGCRGHQRLLRCPRLLKVLDFLGFLCIGLIFRQRDTRITCGSRCVFRLAWGSRAETPQSPKRPVNAEWFSSVS